MNCKRKMLKIAMRLFLELDTFIPSIVFSIKEEVGAYNCYTDGDDN